MRLWTTRDEQQVAIPLVLLEGPHPVCFGGADGGTAWSGLFMPLPKLGVILMLVVSFVKPMACSRYFVVLVQAVLPVLAVQFGALNLNRLGRAALAFGALAGQQWTSTGHGAQAQTPAITSCAGWLPL